MTLADWRAHWMMLALTTACRATPPSWTSSPTKVSVFDAPPAAGATYFAKMENRESRKGGVVVRAEHGTFRCDRHVGIVDLETVSATVRAEALETCPSELARTLASRAGWFVDDAAGQRWLTGAELLAAAGPIDTPQKALLAVWATGTYELNWIDSKRQVVSVADGRVRPVQGGFEVAATTSTKKPSGKQCEDRVTNYLVTLFVDATGAIRERSRFETSSDLVEGCIRYGRRPADFDDIAADDSVAGYLRRAMHHEAESVRAFERIARELAAHGAPAELIAAARDAADDERDHAARCARLVGAVATIATDRLPVRSLVELAIDNVVEGCVGEAYAALAAVVQARSARRPELRAHFAAIAADELAHAALASAIAAWLTPRLTTTERARVRAAASAAVAELAGVAPRLSPDLGLPDPAHAALLVRAVAATAIA